MPNAAAQAGAPAIRALGMCPAWGCKTRVNLATEGGQIAMRWVLREWHMDGTYEERMLEGARTVDCLSRAANCYDMPEVWLGPCCVEHKAPLHFKRFRARYSEHACDARCTHADGSAEDCSCKCGGANHGMERH